MVFLYFDVVVVDVGGYFLFFVVFFDFDYEYHVGDVDWGFLGDDVIGGVVVLGLLYFGVFFDLVYVFDDDFFVVWEDLDDLVFEVFRVI